MSLFASIFAAVSAGLVGVLTLVWKRYPSRVERNTLAVDELTKLVDSLSEERERLHKIVESQADRLETLAEELTKARGEIRLLEFRLEVLRLRHEHHEYPLDGE